VNFGKDYRGSRERDNLYIVRIFVYSAATSTKYRLSALVKSREYAARQRRLAHSPGVGDTVARGGKVNCAAACVTPAVYVFAGDLYEERRNHKKLRRRVKRFAIY
jgi:hypothetical protein